MWERIYDMSGQKRGDNWYYEWPCKKVMKRMYGSNASLLGIWEGLVFWLSVSRHYGMYFEGE